MIRSGDKTQTIRRSSKAEVGCGLQLYTGQRTPWCTKLMDAVCTGKTFITLTEIMHYDTSTFQTNDEYAKADGFNNYTEMWKFFADKADAAGIYQGYRITWERIKP